MSLRLFGSPYIDQAVGGVGMMGQRSEVLFSREQPYASGKEVMKPSNILHGKNLKIKVTH
jgi:hypothetical protein